MKILLRVFIVAAHVVALLATAVRVVFAWGPVEQGPAWRIATPIGIFVAWLLFAILLIVAWKSVGRATGSKTHLAGLATSALCTPSWFVDLNSLCQRECELVSSGTLEPMALIFLLPSAIVLVVASALFCYYLARLWTWPSWKQEV